ncbi:hypothetical protein [Flavobacterium crassostreae]|uniref:Uncharacterized protein n=1 Tax=Flavobacterium crassostreae TaxID=1763534 RepID=A0A1B9DKN3_9FLAO|nr:hypothetical protein [Flavobacterium crassostreae]OCB70199.1 hypothetical protein LPBF_12195 [Flavobacterium crassostreae]
MIQTSIKLQTIVNFLKENLNIIIVVPAFIGGLWQALELMNIDYSYIRFFSISQIVPDGILILIFLIIAFSSAMFGLFADTIFFIKDETKPIEYLGTDDYEKYRKKELRKWKILFVLIYVGSLAYYIRFMFSKPIYREFKFDVVLICLIIFWLNNVLNRCYYFAKDTSKELFKMCNFFLLILYLIIGNYFSKNLHKIFIVPDNIINIEKVISEVNIKFPNSKQELLYFNDKYIFFKITDKLKKEKVYITKIDNLFNE